MRLAFTLAVFLSAALLFVVEPMFGKMVLPLLGGSPAVWTTCMLFFQAALLLGYLYAHVASRWMGEHRHMLLHVGLLALALLILPIGVIEPSEALRQNHPGIWLIGTLALSLGAPFILLSSTTPLLQVWFSRSSHREAGNPYFLYVASNAGSLLALLSYPFWVEPTIPLGKQAWLWRWGYVALIVLVAICLLFWMTRAPLPRREVTVAPERIPHLEKRLVTRWLILAFVPSSFLLALTSHITTDMAAVPLLWIVPLVLYLLSFTMVFGRRVILPHRALVRWQPIGLICLVILEFWGQSASSIWLLPLHLLVFFITALVCHGELAATKPPAGRLTEYYICIALGGLLGGIFNALVAPALFKSVLEYPITLVIACAVRPVLEDRPPIRSLRRDMALLGFACVLLVATRVGSGDHPVAAAAVVASALAAVICLRLSRDPMRLTAAVGGVVLAGTLAGMARRDVLLRERNFFGVREVREDAQNRLHVLMNGTTRHGAQSIDPARRREPISYYNRQGPLGDVFRAFPSSAGRKVAVVGLGTGAMAAYGSSGDEWTFYEIDPDISALAHDPRYFTYLNDTAAKINVVFGDGRLSLAKAPDGHYDLIVLDAFSSDAIPTHLLTLEALSAYRRKLSTRGLLVFHLSNRYLDLEPVLARLIQAAAISGLIRVNTARTRELLESGGDPSIWAALAAGPSLPRGLQDNKEWRPLLTRNDVALWTDDYSNIFRVLRWPGKQP